MVRKGLVVGVALLMLAAIAPFIHGTSDVGIDDSSFRDMYAREHLQYLSNWSVVPSDLSDDENMRTAVTNGVSSQSVYNRPSSLDGPMDSAWPMQSHDTQHSGQSQYSTAANLGAEIWRFSAEERSQVYGSAIIDNNGYVYFTITQYGSLYCLYPNGTKKWVFETIDYGYGSIWSTPAIAENGTTYIGTTDTHFYAITPNGTLQWIFDTDAYIESSPTVGQDGTIYFGSDDNKIYAVQSNGEGKWSYTTGGYVSSSPAIANDGTIYVGSGDYNLYALYPNGTFHWKYKTNGRVQGDSAIANDGTIYVPSFDGYLYALYPNGSLKWKATTGNSIAAAGTAQAPDGTIYVGTEILRAYYPNGTLKWSADVQGSIYGTVPAVSADGTIYVSAGGSLVAVNPDGTEKWRKRLTIAQIHSSPCIGSDDRVYVGSETYELIPLGYLHAFGLGPLRAEAGGPYSGLASHTPVQFTGIAFGGQPPYTYFWEFGDGNTSDELEPSHLYRDIGTYTVTFTVTDNEGNSSSDTTTATITYGPPLVKFIQPESAIYLANQKLFPFRYPVAFGRITIEVNVTHPFLPIERVEFYKWDHLQITDTTSPYSWTWSDRIPLLSTHKIGITVFAYTSETYGYDFIEITKFF